MTTIPPTNTTTPPASQSLRDLLAAIGTLAVELFWRLPAAALALVIADARLWLRLRGEGFSYAQVRRFRCAMMELRRHCGQRGADAAVWTLILVQRPPAEKLELIEMMIDLTGEPHRLTPWDAFLAVRRSEEKRNIAAYAAPVDDK